MPGAYPGGSFCTKSLHVSQHHCVAVEAHANILLNEQFAHIFPVMIKNSTLLLAPLDPHFQKRVVFLSLQMLLFDMERIQLLSLGLFLSSPI